MNKLLIYVILSLKDEKQSWLVKFVLITVGLYDIWSIYQWMMENVEKGQNEIMQKKLKN